LFLEIIPVLGFGRGQRFFFGYFGQCKMVKQATTKAGKKANSQH
jgi:hypothetical protein